MTVLITLRRHHWHIQHSVRYLQLQWSVLQKQFTNFSSILFAKRSILDVWYGYGYASGN